METLATQLLDALLTHLKLSGKEGTAAAYSSAVRSAKRMLNTEESFSKLFTPAGIQLYERRLYACGLSNNTTSFYIRMLRAMHNKGVQLGMCPEQPHLFDGVYTGVDSTPKRAISPEIFGKLQALDLSSKPGLAFARDLFILSFSLQGISFVDLAYLRKSNLKGNLLTYHRAKTGSLITVAIPQVACEIIETYMSETENSPYLLPIIANPDKDSRLQYKSALRTCNRRLKKLAEIAGIEEHLTTYVARHTWATVARYLNTPTPLITQAMGHRTEVITQIYFATFDHSILLQVNEKIMTAANLVNNYVSNTNEVERADKKNVSHSISEGHFRLQS